LTEAHVALAADGATDDRRLHVSLDIFDGPLDLLLHLVRERELDIATVSLATVAQQYFDYIAVMDALDVELAAEYLVIAATLLFLKSRSLLPPVPAEFQSDLEDTPEEVEERLRRRLITYSKYKGVAEQLRADQEEASAYSYREAGDPGAPLVQRYRIPAPRLAAALLTAVRNAKPEKRSITRERFSIARQMEFVMQHVREAGRVEFGGLCRGLDLGGVIATFLAILELIRQRRLNFEQEAAEDELHLFVPRLESYAS
jgi:segregation and condensation protein A